MNKKRTNAANVNKDKLDKQANPNAMLAAASRANTQDRAKAYYYGNLGDSIERRYGGGDGLLGEGHDGFQGIMGAGTSWQAQGFGNYFGTGLLNGHGRMYSGAQGGGGGFTYLDGFRQTLHLTIV